MISKRNGRTKPFLISIFFMFFLLGSKENTLISGSYAERDVIEVFPQSTPFLNGISYVDHDMLSLVLGGEAGMNFENFTMLVEEYFIPMNVRTIGLSIGWEEHANTSSSDVMFYKWVDDFLTATDRYEVEVFIIFDPCKKLEGVHSWWDDVLRERPEMQSLIKTRGLDDLNEQALLIIDSPLILEQLEEDLKQLHAYYGKHTSWKGIALRGSERFASLETFDGLIEGIVHNNYTLNNFLDSIFYSRDVDANFTHADGTDCKLWQQFRESKPLLAFSSGYAQRSYPEGLGGEGSSRAIAMVFRANKSSNGFKVSWYGRRVGTPGELKLELYEADINRAIVNASLLETVTVPAELIGTQTGWQPFVEFESRLNEGMLYSIVLRSYVEAPYSKYEVYYRNWRVDDSIFLVSSVVGKVSKWLFKGSSIIWVKDLQDENLLIYPYQDRSIIRNDKSDLIQVFRSTKNVAFNTIFLSVSDRLYDENIATVKIIRNSDGLIVARGSIIPSYTKGMYWWLPVPLESEAYLEDGEEYTLIVERMRAGEGWQVHYLITDPAAAGPQGNGRMMLFRLAYMDPVFVNFMKIGPPGRAGPEAGWPGAENRTWWAQRYSISRTAPLLRVEINIEKYGNPGDLMVRLREDDGTGLAPSDEDIKVVRIPAADIPAGRVWLNVTGWNVKLEARKMYWIILSTDEAPVGNGYWPWKIEYAYQFLIKRSDDAGVSWVRPREPAELYINLFTSEEAFIVEPESIVSQTLVTDNKQIAQSFSLQKGAYVQGLLLFLSRSPSDQDGLLRAEIRPDNGFDSPSTMVLTYGDIRMVEGGITFKGMQIVEFKYPYFLSAGSKYWLVLKGDSTSNIEPQVFAFHYPELSYGGTQLKVKVTGDGGQTWYLPEDKEADLLFGLVNLPYKPHLFTDQELAEDIEAYHVHEVREEPLRGLNNYLSFQASVLQKKLIQWFETYTGSDWFSLSSVQPRVLEEAQGLRELSYVLKVDNISEVEEVLTEFPEVMIIPEINLSEWALPLIEMYYYKVMPNYPKMLTLFDVKDIGILRDFMNSSISNFWNISRFMAYAGGHFGQGCAVVRVLLLGDENMRILSRYLLSTIDVTLVRVDEDANLSRFRDLSSFDVVVLALDRNSMELLKQDAHRRIKEFVERGGGLVVMFPWASWVDEFVGFRFTYESTYPGSPVIIDPRHPILAPYTTIDWYVSNLSSNKMLQISQNVTFVIEDTNGQPLISYNSYGYGRSVLCRAPSSDVGKLPYDYLRLLTNSIFCAAKMENLLPVLWYGGPTRESDLGGGLEYSITGRPGGPILVWANGRDLDTKFQVHLNANYFNTDPKGWIVFDAISWSPIVGGSGSEIKIEFDIRPGIWSPVYVANDTKDYNVLYSNALVTSQKIYPNQVLFNVRALAQQDVWLIARSSTEPREVTLDGDPIKVAGDVLSARGSKAGAYFYDSKNGLLYIKVKAQEIYITIRINTEKAQSPLSILTEYKYILYATIVFMFIIVELYVARQDRMKNLRTPVRISKSFS